MKKIIYLIIILVFQEATAQIDPELLKRIPVDSTGSLNMDAVYKRPFLGLGKVPVSIGGYAEANWQHISTDGISDGHQFQLRRMTLFVSSTISSKIKFLSEIELEEGGKEINIEFAAIDVEFNPLLNLRGGIIMNPIGAFNQNHDGPKWEFTDRPISATEMLPATFSNAGFGFYGKMYKAEWMFGYEVYLCGNFDNSIIDNNQNKTYLPAAKSNPERFEEINSGVPLLTAKIATRHEKAGEFGASYMGGIYNKFQDEGLQVDDKRRIRVFALDYNNTLPNLGTLITAEWAWVKVDVPETYTQQYGNRQHGGFIDIVQPIIKRKILDWEKATVNLACRLEYVDWNVGHFREDNSKIGDDLWSIMPAISFRPNAQTVFRLNYRFQKQKDIFANPAVTTAGFSFGISTYF